MPAPVSTMQATSSRSDSRSNTRVISSRSSMFCAFTGGRFRVTTATPASTVKVMVLRSMKVSLL
ncbi:hypothetical protein D3C86_2081040 [compost metagenome]